MISLTHSRWLFAQHADGGKNVPAQPLFLFVCLNNVPKIEIYSAEQDDLASCRQMSGDPFLSDPPPASRKYLEMHRKQLLISDLAAVSIITGSCKRSGSNPNDTSLLNAINALSVCHWLQMASLEISKRPEITVVQMPAHPVTHFPSI